MSWIILRKIRIDGFSSSLAYQCNANSSKFDGKGNYFVRRFVKFAMFATIFELTREMKSSIQVEEW